MSLLIPLFFKDNHFFSSIGVIAFTLTTPIAVTMLSISLFWINQQKFKALIENISLKEKLLEFETTTKDILKTELDKARSQAEKDANHRTLGEVVSQVAHDIRSPLVALEMVVDNSSSLPEEMRILVRSAVSRIKDIANNLLFENKKLTSIAQSSNSLSAESDSMSIQLIPSLVDSLAWITT